MDAPVRRAGPDVLVPLRQAATALRAVDRQHARGPWQHLRGPAEDHGLTAVEPGADPLATFEDLVHRPERLQQSGQELVAPPLAGPLADLFDALADWAATEEFTAHREPTPAVDEAYRSALRAAERVCAGRTIATQGPL